MTKSYQELWGRLLNACAEVEKESLMGERISGKGAEKLVLRYWATFDPISYEFVTHEKVPEGLPAVEVLMVQRDGGFKIHDDVLYHLWKHPLFADEIATVGSKYPREVFQKKLEEIEQIERDHHLVGEEYVPEIAEQDGPDRSAAVCSMAGEKLRMLLADWYRDSRGGGKSDWFPDEEIPADNEDLGWLSEAEQGNHLWVLLNAAIEFGESLCYYKVFSDGSIEATVRRMKDAFPGKQATPEGKAVESIVRSFMEANGDNPTPESLFKWLGGERPTYNRDLLIVENELWVDALKRLSWKEFKNLVKGARARIKRAASSKTFQTDN